MVRIMLAAKYGTNGGSFSSFKETSAGIIYQLAGWIEYWSKGYRNYARLNPEIRFSQLNI